MIKKYLFHILFFIALFDLGSCSMLFSQAAWIRKLDLDRLDAPGGLIEGDTGTFYITHRYSNGGGGPVTQNLTKMSLSGNEIWTLKFENYPFHVFEGPVAKLPNNDVLVCFLFEDSLTSASHLYRINPVGEIKWAISLPSIVQHEIDYSFRVYKIIASTPNDIRLYFRMNYYWEFDPPSAKNGYISLDSLGQEKHRVYFDTNGEYQWPYNIIQTQDTHFVKVYRPTLGQLELLLRYDLVDGEDNQAWSYEIGPQDEGGGGPVCTDANGNVYFTWNHDTTGNGSISNQFPSIFSLDKQGEFRWSRQFGEDRGIPVFFDIISMTDGRIVACGQEGNDNLSGGNYRTGWIVCIDTMGNTLWERRYVLNEASESGNNFYYAIESEDGGLILSGVIYYQDGGRDVYVLRTDSEGCLIEGCELYNFISFFTNTKNVIEDENVFNIYLDNSTLSIISKEIFYLENLSYEMINLSGIVMMKGEINDGGTQINVAGLMPGLYLIGIHNELGKSVSLLKFFKAD